MARSETTEAKKAPGFYRKVLNEKTLEKKYLKFIQIPLDKDFIRECYEKKDDGFHIRTDLDKEKVKRLKALAADIKRNRKGAINLLPLGIAAALAAGAVVFFTVFANPLLGRALKLGLEAVFEARVDVDRFRLSIIDFEISLGGLTIADRDSPMQNLIQFDRMAIRLRPNAVLRGKVYIEEIRADALRFGTPRTVSGALPGKLPKEKAPPRERFEMPHLVDLQNFDAMALLDQEFDKLQTPKIYGEALNAFDEASAKWKEQADSARARFGELQTQAQPLLALNINDYRTFDQETLERIRTTVNQIETLTDTVRGAADDVNRIVTEAQNDFNAALRLVENAKNSITGDIDHLRSYVDLSSGAAMEVLEPVVKDLLTDTAESYLAYGARALEILAMIKEIQAQLPKPDPKELKEKKERFKGRDVMFPVRNYPKFYLGTLASDVFTQNNWHWGFDLSDVSSDPELSGKPAALTLVLAETGDGLRRTAGFRGTADFRSNAAERFTADISGGGFPVNLNTQLSQAGIGGFSGNASFGLDLSGRTDGSFLSSGSIFFGHSQIIDPSNTITQAISQAMTEAGSLDLNIRYEHRASSSDTFSLNTNIGDIAAAALKRIVDEYKEKAFAELERLLNEKLSSFLERTSVSQGDMENLLRIVQGDRTAAEQLRNTLSGKKDEFENRLRSAAEDAARQAVDSARTQGEQALQDMLQGNTPQTPSVPSINLPVPGGLPFGR